MGGGIKSMKIYIGKDHEGYVIGLILAKTKEIANTFFQAKYNCEVYNIDEIDVNTIDQTQLYYNLIETHKRTVTDSEWGKIMDVRLINKR